MNIASIDIGTNTVLLLIANIAKPGEKINYLLNMHKIPRIGKGLIPGQPIAPSKIDELLNVIDEYKSIIERYECRKIIAYATNAFRIASNSNSIIEEVFSRSGIQISVISGKEEARLSYLGVSSEAEADNRIVIDIGGGSTEIVIGRRDEIVFSHSYSAGAVSLKERFGDLNFYNSGPGSEPDTFLSDIFNELNGKNISGAEAYAVAGTPTSLSCIKNKYAIFSEEKVEGSFIYGNELPGLLRILTDTPGDLLLEKYGEILKGRADILPAGTLILIKIMDIMNLERIYVSTRGLRYGAILDYLQKLH